MQKDYKNDRESVTDRHYMAVHYWLKKKFGKADRCENPKCSGTSTNYQWAKKKGKEYDFKRVNFKMLCRSCHAKQDMTDRTRKYLRDINKNTHKTHCVKGHALTPENTYMVGNWRHCKTCKKWFRIISQRKKRGTNMKDTKLEIPKEFLPSLQSGDGGEAGING